MEFDLIELIKTHCPVRRDDVMIGIGDDAAAVRVCGASEGLVICQDTLNAEIHFRKDDPPETIGHKALAVNLSDIAAMGASPSWATLSLSLPSPDRDWVAAFIRGFAALARRFDVDLVGGDTTRGPLSISVCLTGHLAGPALRRGAAHAGDDLWVSGSLGDAAAALQSDQAHFRSQLQTPEPRVALGLALRGIASACIDLSDGLTADLPRLLGRSIGATVWLDNVPLSDAMMATFSRSQAWQLALSGGDDYELLFAAPAERRRQIEQLAAATSLSRIGTITARSAIDYLDSAGQPQAFNRGYEHFA